MRKHLGDAIKDGGMKSLARREFLRLGLCATAAPMMPRIAAAQSYPSRPVRLVVGLAPGGAVDILARLVGEWLSRYLGQPVVIENRPGDAGSVAAEVVLRSPADGYTLFMATSANVINAQRHKVNFVRDSTAVAIVGQEPIILSVNPSLTVKTLAEFIAYAKENPGKLNMASPGNGSVPHIAGELFKLMAGIDMVHVPYRGGAPALIDLMSGQVQVAFMGPAASLTFIKAEKIRALAVTSEARAAVLPDIPAAGEFVPGYEASQWFGVVAPKDTAPDVVSKLNAGINAGLADPQLRTRLLDLGESVVPRSSAEFGQRIVRDAEKWAKVIQAAHIKI
ncbi:MAG TPA: tripartite tricarboxylate transporter substrate binding protein [Pseudolabrys sp.]|nr:tripartite tricarboxylate transporter substrate binding protein [Pseudolabrys sp.]